MVVSRSVTSHSAGRAAVAATACGAATAAVAMPRKASARFRNLKIIASPFEEEELNNRCRNAPCPCKDDRPKPAKRCAGLFRVAEFPGPHSDAAPLLGRAGLRPYAALRSRDGRGDVSPGDGASSARPGPVEGRVRAAVPQAHGRPLWREPQPAGPLLPVPGDP